MTVTFEKEMTPSIKYRGDAPKILLMWILSLVLIIMVIVIIILSTFICRARRKFSPTKSPEPLREKVYLEQEFPHEKITKLSSTVRRIKDQNQVLKNLRVSETEGDLYRRSSVSSPVYNPVNQLSGSARYSRADINQCGLPLPRTNLQPPLASQYFMRSKSVGFTRNRVRDGPRASIPRSIKKLHWEDVNNNPEPESYLSPDHSLAPYAEETMKSSGESVYF